MPEGSAENPKDIGTDVARWDAELRLYEKAAEQWSKDAKEIGQRYSLESQRSAGSEKSTSFNILWSNINTMQPSLYGQEPTPVVQRRHGDQDPIGRMASEILQRALTTEMELVDDWLDLGKRVVLDLLLVGRGTPWVRYTAETAKVKEQGENGEETEVERMKSEKSPIAFVFWDDFAHAPRKTWAEVQDGGWVARKVNMTRAQGIKRFKEKFETVPLKHQSQAGATGADADKSMHLLGVAEVWEIWDASDKMVYWINRDHKGEVLDKKSDPLGLTHFFPCPKPAYGSIGNDSLIPNPDYLQYKPLANELDIITQRISKLVAELRVRGFYNASAPGMGLLLSGKKDGEMIPVEGVAGLGGAGGIDRLVSFLPLDVIAGALVGLYNARDQVKNLIYEISGISDIQRGSVDPREKLGQSRLKSQFGSQRMASRRTAVAMCIRDTLRIKAELMAEHYSPETLRALSGYDFLPEVVKIRNAPQPQPQPGFPSPPDPEMVIEDNFRRAVELLKDEKLRGFRVEIETNSTVAPDMAEEQEQRTVFLGVVGEFLEKALGIAQAVPPMAPLMGDLLLFVVRGFNAGRGLESSFEEALQQLRDGVDDQQNQPPAAEPGPDPAAQAAQQKQQMDVQAAQQKLQIEGQAGQQKLQQSQAEGALKLQGMESDAGFSQRKAMMDIEKMVMETQLKLQAIEAELSAKADKNEIDRDAGLIALATKSQGPA